MKPENVAAAVFGVALFLLPVLLVGGIERVVFAVVAVSYTFFVGGILLMLLAWAIGGLFVDLASPSRPILRTFFTALALLPVGGGVAAFWLGLPPEPPIVLSLNLFIGVYWICIVAGLGLGLYIREMASAATWPRNIGGAAAQIVVSLFVLSIPFTWTLSSTRSAALATRALEAGIAAECPSLNAPIAIAHISDTHITARGKPTREGQVGGNDHLPELLSEIALRNPAYLLISGDVTDTGSPDEWRTFADIVKPYRNKMMIVLAPGNHDVNMAFGDDPSGDSYTDSSDLRTKGYEELSRIGRVYAAQSSLSPDMHVRSGMTIGELLAESPGVDAQRAFADLHSTCFNECARIPADKPAARNAACSRGCDDWRVLRRYYYKSLSREFPWVQVDSDRSLMVIVLATSIPAVEDRTLGRNAIGHIDLEQVAALRESVRSAPPNVKTFVVVFHHPITNIRGQDEEAPWHSLDASRTTSMKTWWLNVRSQWENSSWWARAFLRTNPLESRVLLAALDDEMRARKAHGVVMFGHRHEQSFAGWHNLSFAEAPSVSPPGGKGGFYAVTPSAGPPVVAWCPY